jgi:hypothetical protein
MLPNFLKADYLFTGKYKLKVRLENHAFKKKC